MKINSSFIRLCIAERCMTLNDVERKSGIAQNSLASILRRGSCSTVTAGLIARSLGVPVARIVSTEEDRAEENNSRKSLGEPEPFKWISMKERLPELDDYVVVFDAKTGGFNFLCLLDIAGEGLRWCETTEDGSVIYSFDFGEFTHWMTLVAAPSEEGC